MREIKFRARNAQLPRCWIYGYLVTENGCCYIVNSDGKFKVISGTEGQFTGLKDANDKDLYEGDILQWCTTINVKNKWKVEATQGGWNPFIDDMTTDKSFRYQVIGNNYGNPELLK